jgi:hypothetical protein
MERNLKSFDLTSSLKKGGHAPLKKYSNDDFFTVIFYRSSFIGILLGAVGIIFFYNPTNLNIKIGSSLILTGYFFMMFFNINERTDERVVTGQYIFLIFTIWLFIVFAITYNLDADIFLIIVILGIISIRELLVEYITIQLQTRMNIHFYILLIIFIIIIGQKIINIINI